MISNNNPDQYSFAVALAYAIMTAPNPLMVLTDSDVQSILGNLNKSEIERMQASLRSTLHEYSTGNQDQPCCHTNQKERMVIENSNGTTTLVMPARSSVGMSLKGKIFRI